MASRVTTDCEGFHRRDFLKIGAAGLLGLTLPQLLQLEAQAARRDDATKNRKANSVIMVWLAGGPATIDMWDLKPEAPEGIRGEFKPIDTSADGVQISEHLPQDGRGHGQGHHRPLAAPHHPVARSRPRSS